MSAFVRNIVVPSSPSGQYKDPICNSQTNKTWGFSFGCTQTRYELSFKSCNRASDISRIKIGNSAAPVGNCAALRGKICLLRGKLRGFLLTLFLISICITLIAWYLWMSCNPQISKWSYFFGLEFFKVCE